MKRTQYCGDLRREHIDQIVTLCGWVWHRRDHGGVIFIDIRDRTGHSQLVFDPTLDAEVHKKANDLRSEYCIRISGKVRLRPEGTINPNMSTGEVEIVVQDLFVYSESETPPFQIEDHVDVGEDIRLKYRFLDFRRPSLRNTLMFRSKCANVVRNYMTDNGFVEIETPVLSKSTPEGARDFLVPSRICPGDFFCSAAIPAVI